MTAPLDLGPQIMVVREALVQEWSKSRNRHQKLSQREHKTLTHTHTHRATQQRQRERESARERRSGPSGRAAMDPLSDVG